MIRLHLSEALTYGLLSLALLSLWLPQPKVFPSRLKLWHLFAALAVSSALQFGTLQLTGLLPLALLVGLCVISTTRTLPRSLRLTATLLLFVLSSALSLHLVPGFANALVVNELVLSPGGIPYTKYLNFDKGCVALFLLALAGFPLLSTAQGWKQMGKRTLPLAIGTIAILLALSLAFGYVRFDPKWPTIFWFWAWSNLLFTCMAEEVVFRGILQRTLIDYLPDSRSGAIAGVSLAALLFGALHFAGGMHYVLLATVAGLGYGWIYQRSQQLEAAILAHFTLNSLHFFFFTYPALASAVS